MHGMELPFVFDHPDIAFMTGAGASAAGSARKMSEAWVSFARNGNPNHSGCRSGSLQPRPLGDDGVRQRLRAVKDPLGEERRAMQAARDSGVPVE